MHAWCDSVPGIELANRSVFGLGRNAASMLEHNSLSNISNNWIGVRLVTPSVDET